MSLMTLRSCFLILCCLSARSGAAKIQVPGSEKPARRPNVVLVITDDQGYGDIHAHGNAKIRTPNMDALAAQSISLTDFHVDPTCSPSRAALMTGRYSTRTGVWHTIMGRSLMAPTELTLAETFKAGGYRTGMFGKWHLGENFPLRPQDQGFDEVVCHGGGGVGQGPDWWGNDYFDDTYFRNGTPEKFKGYCTDVWFREAASFIEKHRDQPFFCYLSTNAPHGPLLVDEKWSRPYEADGVAPAQAKFYGMIENIDHNLGRLLKRLDRLGLADDTVFVFMTDNGTANGRVNQKLVRLGKWGGFNAGMRGAKGSEYDGGHRVPLFIRWPNGGLGGAPGKPGAGRQEDSLCAHIDVLPTLAALCGIEKPAGPAIDGIDLTPRLRQPESPRVERTLFVHSQRIPEPKKWRKCSVMTERWRLVNGKELFDILADPAQSTDLAAQEADVVAKLSSAYDAWWESLTPAFGQPVRIGLGSDRETTAQLHPHDWQVESQKLSSWHQNHVRRGHAGQGKWFIDLLRPGSYEFELRRWPRHLDRPMEAEEARVLISDQNLRKRIAAGAREVRFVIDLPAGPTTLETVMSLPDGKTRGCYFVYVTRVNPPPGALIPDFARMVIGAPPEALGLDPFYKKHTDAFGLPVVSSEKVPDAALLVARDIVNFMLSMRPDIRKVMIARRFRVGVMAQSEMQTDLPEHRHMKKPRKDDRRLTPAERASYDRPGGIGSMTDREYWNQRARGLGGRFTTGAEENILGYPGTRYFGENILVHELSHGIMRALRRADPDLNRQIHEAYDDAMAKGRFKHHYAATTVDEYWAEGTQWWFWSNYEWHDGDQRLQTPEDLEAYDPRLFALLSRVYPGHHIPADVYHGRNLGPR